MLILQSVVLLTLGVFLTVYGITVRWEATSAGRHLMLFTTAVVLVVTAHVLDGLLGSGAELVAYGLLLVATVQRIRLIFTTRKKEDDDR